MEWNYLLLLFAFIVLLLVLMKLYDCEEENDKEHMGGLTMQLSNEAIQNIASVYNNDKFVVSSIDTGPINATAINAASVTAPNANITTKLTTPSIDASAVKASAVSGDTVVLGNTGTGPSSAIDLAKFYGQNSDNSPFYYYVNSSGKLGLKNGTDVFYFNKYGDKVDDNVPSWYRSPGGRRFADGYFSTDSITNLTQSECEKRCEANPFCLQTLWSSSKNCYLYAPAFSSDFIYGVRQNVSGDFKRYPYGTMTGGVLGTATKVSGIDACEKLAKENPSCMYYTYEKNGTCALRGLATTSDNTSVVSHKSYSNNPVS